MVHGVDLEIPGRASLAIVGASGAGKTTLAAVLGGVIAPSGGTVRFRDAAGGVRLSDLDGSVLPDWVAMLSQDAFVLSGSVRENLTLAAPGASDERLADALARVGAADWLRSLPARLDTELDDGARG